MRDAAPWWQPDPREVLRIEGGHALNGRWRLGGAKNAVLPLMVAALLTPHLVTPVAGEALALPTDRVRIPTERELFLFGDVASSPKKGAAAEVARQDFSSSYGYVME